MEHYLTYKRVIDLLELFQQTSVRMNSFGYGSLVDFGTNPEMTPTYPLLFVVPQSMTMDENTTTYNLSIIFADRMNDNTDNDISIISDMTLEARQLLSEIKRGFLRDYIETELPTELQPFKERFNDYVAGVALNLNIITFEDINACVLYEENYLLQENLSKILQEDENKIKI